MTVQKKAACREERRMGSSRRAADARYRSLFDAALDAIFISTPQGILVEVNPAACALTGYTQAELTEQRLSLLFGPEELARRPLRHDFPKDRGTLARVLTRKDGSQVTVEVAAAPMPDGLVLKVMRDITEIKRNEALLMNVARGVSAQVGSVFFRSLVAHLARELQADYAYIGELVPPNTDMRTLALLADGKRVENPEALVEGSMSAEALAAGDTVIFAQGVRRRFPQSAEAAEHGMDAYVGTPLFGADAKPLGVLAVAHRSRIEHPQLWASMIEIFGARAAAEIERSRAEMRVRETNESLEQIVQERTAQAAEAIRELDSYNYSISHDLRQPLNAITGFADLLLEHPAIAAQADAAEFAAEIQKNAARMEQMIDSLLQLARASRGAIRKSEVDVGALVQAIVRELESQGELAAEITVGPLPPAQADPVLLRQVWANLIGNAVKYSRKTQAPRVEIAGSRNGAGVEYAVRDNGVGFDMRDAGRLFRTFERLPGAGEFEGHGIGLAIAERIVTRHGGRISAQSVPGQGSTFRFSFPD